jgi:hypothetical protein
MRWWRCFGALLASATLVSARGALAEETPTPVALSYVAPAECPSVATFRARVLALTPRVVWVETPEASRRLSIRMALDARGARGALTVRGADKQGQVRQLQAASCAELSEAMAIIVALIFDPDAKLSPPAEPAPSKPAAAPRPAPAPRRSVSARFNLELFVVGGPTPNPAVGAALGVSVLFLERSPLQLGVRASARASADQDLSTQYGSASFAWRALSLELCPLGGALHRLVRVEGCGLFDAGQIVASADSNPDVEAQRTWLAPGGGVYLGFYPLDFLGLEATGAVSLPLIRDRFLLTPFAIHQPPAVAFRGGLALSVQFF